jgi:hypothetical protein
VECSRFLIKFRPPYDTGVDSDSNRSEYEGSSRGGGGGVKAAGEWNWQPCHHHLPIFWYSWKSQITGALGVCLGFYRITFTFTGSDMGTKCPQYLSYNGYRVSSPGLKWPGRGFNHPPPSISEVEERVEVCLYSPSGYSWPVLERTLPFTSSCLCVLIPWPFLCSYTFVYVGCHAGALVIGCKTCVQQIDSNKLLLIVSLMHKYQKTAPHHYASTQVQCFAVCEVTYRPNIFLSLQESRLPRYLLLSLDC